MLIHGHDLPDLKDAAQIARSMGSRYPEDDAQDAYVRFVEGGCDTTRCPAVQWYWRLLKQRVIDRLRSHFSARSNDIVGDYQGPDRDMITVLVAREDARRAMAICNGSGEIFDLIDAGYTIDKAARALKMNPGTVRSKMSRARAKVMESMGEIR